MSEQNTQLQPIPQEPTAIPPFNNTRSIQQITNDIWKAKGNILCSFIDIGKALDEAKGILKKEGQWLKWLETSVDISVREAQRYIQLAKAFPDATLVSHLGMTKTLAVLALPEGQREDFIKKPHEVNGRQKLIDDMTVHEVKRIIQEQTKPIDGSDKCISDSTEAAEGSNPTPQENSSPANTDDTSGCIPVYHRKRPEPESKVQFKPSGTKNITTDIESAQALLDSILKVLESQGTSETIDGKIVNDLRSLHDKIQKCFALVNLEADTD